MRRIAVAAVLALAALGLAGCTGTGGSGISTVSSSGSAVRAPDTAPGQGGATKDATGTLVTGAGSARQVITTGTVAITVDSPATAADAAVRLVEATGGRVDGRDERAPTGGDPGSAQLVLRIPTAKLSATIDQLKTLGRLENISLSTQDVTGQAQDLTARITALQTSVDRLVALMARAATTADLISIESALSERQSNLESLQAQKRAMDDEVDLATITLQLGTAATAPVHPPGTFLSGLIAGWNAFVAFLSGVLVIVGVLLPWLAFLALLAGIGFIVFRIRRSRARSVGHP
jgi:predicted small secreted protein